jgi:hypothetical protein
MSALPSSVAPRQALLACRLTSPSVAPRATLGHDLEYQLSYGTDYNRVNDFPQGWTTADNLSITWDSVHAYNYVIVTARCIAHPEVQEKSSYIVVNIGN